jgi:hypothetical protein
MLLGRRRNKAPAVCVRLEIAADVGLAPGAISRSGIHAMALQPVHAKLPVRPVAHWLLTFALLYSGVSFAQVPGVAQGIPEPEHRNVIVQLFNWR